MKSYGDEQKISLFAFRENEHSWRQENQQLIKRLELYQNVPLLGMSV